jgi:hypothetical protein
MTEWEQKERVDMGAALIALSDCAGRSTSKKLFVEYLSKDHRTRQQCITGLMLEWFKHLASLNENQYDLRNEASVKIAKKIIDAISEDGYVPTLPYF